MNGKGKGVRSGSEVNNDQNTLNKILKELILKVETTSSTGRDLINRKRNKKIRKLSRKRWRDWLKRFKFT